MGHCNKTTCLPTSGAHVLLLQPSHLTDWRESHYRPLHLSDDSHCHMYKKVHKKQHVFSLRFTLLLSPNNMAQNKIKLHSKMGIVSTGGGGKAVTEKEISRAETVLNFTLPVLLGRELKSVHLWSLVLPSGKVAPQPSPIKPFP